MKRSAALFLVVLTSTQQGVSGQDPLEATLARIYAEYVRVRSHAQVSTLVRLDQELRKVFPRYIRAGTQSVTSSYFRPGYEDVGIAGVLFEPELLAYTGKLLRDAHAINLHSAYRQYTFYATVFPNGEDSGDIPDLRAARAYIREFPAGPFAADAYLELAHFRDDLFKFIRNMLSGDDYKRDCYGPYLTAQPYRQQLRAAQASGIANYERVLVLRPNDELARASLAELRSGTTEGWFYCGD